MTERPLGPRQQLVLETLRPGQSVTAEQIGRLLHDRRWRECCGPHPFGCTPSHHPADVTCDHCAREGADVLLALYRRGLVRVLAVEAELREAAES